MELSDDTMLLYAAKAANITHGDMRSTSGISIRDNKGGYISLPQWNPLENNADAFDLMVKLKIYVGYDDLSPSVSCATDTITWRDIPYNNEDELSRGEATRRCIVTVAALIGELMFCYKLKGSNGDEYYS